MNPVSAFRLECQLAKLLWEVGRRIAQRVYNGLEPDDPKLTPRRVRLGLDEYRRNRKTFGKVSCLFGPIRLKRFVYQSTLPGEAGIFPLERALGIVSHAATPALADQVGRLMAELTQQQALGVLRERYGVSWSVGTLRKVVAGLAEQWSPLRHQGQVCRLLEQLSKAFQSRGKYRPALVVGRDGVMVPMRPFWEEGATATVSVYDRQGRRLGTVYLGRMPELGQGTIKEQLTRLILDTFAEWEGPLPRLHYVTDAGHHPQEYYREVLKPMNHPRTGKRMEWTWAVDYYHAAERITTLAEAIFGAGREATDWAEKMRRVLKEKRAGASRLVRSAKVLRSRRGLRGYRKEFDEAINYLTKYRTHMNYASYRRVRLPIGSGVTEAACKTIFNYRFKQSGMRWNGETGQHVLDLRVILKSGVWDHVRILSLQSRNPCRLVESELTQQDKRGYPLIYALPA